MTSAGGGRWSTSIGAPCSRRRDQGEEQRCRLGVEGDVADLVDDDQWQAADAFELLVEAPAALGRREARHPLLGAGEGHAVAPTRGLHAEGDVEVRLAGARRPGEDHVHVLGEEVELGEVQHGLALHGAREAEVEVVEGLDRREARRLDARLAAVALPGGHLFAEDRRQVLLVAPGALAGALGQGARALTHPRRLQGPREEGDLAGGGAAHSGAPTRAS